MKNELTWQSNQIVTEIASFTLTMTFKTNLFRVDNYVSQDGIIKILLVDQEYIWQNH